MAISGVALLVLDSHHPLARFSLFPLPLFRGQETLLNQTTRPWPGSKRFYPFWVARKSGTTTEIQDVFGSSFCANKIIEKQIPSVKWQAQKVCPRRSCKGVEVLRSDDKNSATELRFFWFFWDSHVSTPLNLPSTSVSPRHFHKPWRKAKQEFHLISKVIKNQAPCFSGLVVAIFKGHAAAMSPSCSNSFSRSFKESISSSWASW